MLNYKEYRNIVKDIEFNILSKITVRLQKYFQKVGTSFSLLLGEGGPFSSVSTPQRSTHCDPHNEIEIKVHMYQNIHTSDISKSSACFGTA